jgi:hypothetical protein
MSSEQVTGRDAPSLRTERPVGAPLCVIHLVRRGGGTDLLERFITSYAEHDPGIPHRLVLLLKGFRSPEEALPYTRVAAPLVDGAIEVDDSGFDLTAYATAALRLDCERLCFLNSNSVILHSGWLAKLHAALTSDVGIVGATGSWNSSLSILSYLMHLPSAYAELFPDRVWLQTQLRALATAANDPDVQAPSLRSNVTAALEKFGGALYAQFTSRRFPARHVRTNAFLLRAATMRDLRVWPLRHKQQAWRLESGRGGVTSQIEQMGLRTLVVGRDGIAYEPDDWHRSGTFWQGDQPNLLVGDNQTKLYQSGDDDRRILLSRLAWGRSAQPLVGGAASIDASAKRE